MNQIDHRAPSFLQVNLKEDLGFGQEQETGYLRETSCQFVYWCREVYKVWFFVHVHMYMYVYMCCAVHKVLVGKLRCDVQIVQCMSVIICRSCLYECFTCRVYCFSIPTCIYQCTRTQLTQFRKGSQPLKINV